MKTGGHEDLSHGKLRRHDVLAPLSLMTLRHTRLLHLAPPAPPISKISHHPRAETSADRTSGLVFGGNLKPKLQKQFKVMQNQVVLTRLVRRRLTAALKARSPPVRNVQRRWLTPAPKAGDGPLMSRRADRELPGSFGTPHYAILCH